MARTKTITPPPPPPTYDMADPNDGLPTTYGLDGLCRPDPTIRAGFLRGEPAWRSEHTFNEVLDPDRLEQLLVADPAVLACAEAAARKPTKAALGRLEEAVRIAFWSAYVMDLSDEFMERLPLVASYLAARAAALGRGAAVYDPHRCAKVMAEHCQKRRGDRVAG
jgi:hypothetical protein